MLIYHGKGIKIPWGGVSKYHGKVGVYTIESMVDIPWGGVLKYQGKVGVYTIGRVIKIPWVADQYSMGRGSKYHG